MKRLEKVDLTVYTRQIIRQSVWCGTVFALSVLLCVLNALPPVPVKYEVVGKVLIESRRIEGLVHNLRRATSLAESTVLRDFQVLARSQSPMTIQPSEIQTAEGETAEILMANRTDANRILPENEKKFTEPVQKTVGPLHDSDQILLSVSSLWNVRCRPNDFSKWLDDLTQLNPNRSSDSELASSLRMARWELSAAQHYRDHHEFLSQSELPSAGESSRFQLTTTEGQRTSGQLVASSTRATSSSPPDIDEPPQSRQQLENNLRAAQQKLESLELMSRQALQTASGTISLIDVPRVVPIADRIPPWMAASVLIIMVSVGSIVGWCQKRLQSGGIYEPQEVGEILASRGLAVAAKLQLPGEQLESSDWLEIASRQASGAGRRAGRNLIRLSEFTLAVWCLLIIARTAADPMWRCLLLDSPLAAFGRLVAGMP